LCAELLLSFFLLEKWTADHWPCIAAFFQNDVDEEQNDEEGKISCLSDNKVIVTGCIYKLSYAWENTLRARRFTDSS